MASDDIYFMQVALQQARKAYVVQEVPVGAVIVLDGKIVAQAHNSVQALQDATAHAELLALHQAFENLGQKYLPACTLYTTLEPCPMCAGAGYWAQLGRLVFGAKDPKKGYGLWQQPLLHPKTEVVQGVLAEESTQLLQQFFQNLRK